MLRPILQLKQDVRMLVFLVHNNYSGWKEQTNFCNNKPTRKYRYDLQKQINFPKSEWSLKNRNSLQIHNPDQAYSGCRRLPGKIFKCTASQHPRSSCTLKHILIRCPASCTAEQIKFTCCFCTWDSKCRICYYLFSTYFQELILYRNATTPPPTPYVLE